MSSFVPRACLAAHWSVSVGTALGPGHTPLPSDASWRWHRPSACAHSGCAVLVPGMTSASQLLSGRPGRDVRTLFVPIVRVGGQSLGSGVAVGLGVLVGAPCPGLTALSALAELLCHARRRGAPPPLPSAQVRPGAQERLTRSLSSWLQAEETQPSPTFCCGGQGLGPQASWACGHW